MSDFASVANSADRVAFNFAFDNDYDCRSLFSGNGERRFFFWRCRNRRVIIAPLRQTRSYAILERCALYGISAHALSPESAKKSGVKPPSALAPAFVVAT